MTDIADKRMADFAIRKMASLREIIANEPSREERLETALRACIAAFENHGKRTSLAEWDKKLKAAAALARKALQ